MPKRSRRLESRFPKLRSVQYQVTSKPSILYNCVAWVFGDRTNVWDLGRYWPSRTELGETVASMVNFFRSFGFQQCGQDGSLETGFEKIAIYGNPSSMTFTHVACQQSDGSWSSKLGLGHDIIHPDLDCLTGNRLSEYGAVILYMKWQIQNQSTNPSE